MSPRERDDAPAGWRTFHGNGFRFDLPEEWSDLTTYTFRGPRLRQFEPVICVQTEPGAGFETASDYAEARLPRALRAASGGRLLKRRRVRLGSNAEGVEAEIRWAPDRETTWYQRVIYAVFEGCGFAAGVTLDRHARKALGPAVQRVLETFRPWGAGWRSNREGDATWIGDRFRIELPDGWKDESQLLLAEPDADRFRRNLVVRRVPLDEDPGGLALWADAEAELLAGSLPKFELLASRETTTRDEGFAHVLDFLRDAEDGDRLRQVQLAAWRRGAFHTLMLTLEAEPPARVERLIEPLLRSFESRGGGRG